MITILTDAEKNPLVIGFALEEDENEFKEADGEQIDDEILAPEDAEIEGQDIDRGDAKVGPQGVDIQEKIIVCCPSSEYSCVASTGADFLWTFNFRWQGQMLQQVDQGTESSALCSQTCRGYDAT